MKSALARREFGCMLACVVGGALLPARLTGSQLVGERTPPAPDGTGKPLLFGSAIDSDGICDAPVAGLAIAACDWLSPRSELGWSAVQPDAGQWSLAPADAIVRFARTAGKQVRGSALICDRTTPDWAVAAMRTTRDWTIVDAYLRAMLTRYDRGVSEWDVVCEPIDTVAGDHGLRRTAFHRSFGPGYIDRAFATARRFAPHATLMMSEYGLETVDALDRDRRDAVLRLAEAMLDRGVPIDGIAMQARLDRTRGPLDEHGLTAFVRAVGDLGLSISITELDVKGPPGSCAAERDRAAADHVRRYLDVCLAEPNVRGLVSAGLRDRTDETGTGHPAPEGNLPFSAQLCPRPIYWTIQNALARHRFAARHG